jgi:5-formaminoimidazole-4-carboxamide-1-beta-D-ribofuranosyl 5'-monophosphate synthetase
MEAGIKLQEQFYNTMLNDMVKPLRVQKTIDIIVKIANDKKVSADEIKFVTSGLDVSFEIPYRPFRTRLDIVDDSSNHRFKHLTLNIINKPQNDVTYKSYKVAKVDVMNKDGFNFFYLFPKKNKLLIINNILIPPMIFCEYNGLFWMYKINFNHRSVGLYNKQFMYTGGLRNSQDKFFDKITQKPQKIINKNIKEFLLIYSNYLKANL